MTSTIAHILAHELGHAMGLGHAPCGTRASDAFYPYPDGSIGAYGFNVRTTELHGPELTDPLGYCGPKWISDYHYETALAFRQENDRDDTAATRP